MSTSPVEPLTIEEYDQAAREYGESLPLEHFMESTAQSIQRDITVTSLTALRQRRGGLIFFSELLIQWRRGNQWRRVVPDNMVVLSDEDPIVPRTSFPFERESAPPFMTLEYVSTSNRWKDYNDSFRKYEQELEVPYYTIFSPDEGTLNVYHLEPGGRYQPLKPNSHGRLAVRELDLELALLDGWLRFWHQDELLLISEELLRELSTFKRRIQEQDEQLRQRDEQLQEKDHQLTAMSAALRKLVRQRATKLGRDDVLSAVDEANGEQLSQWLSEMEMSD